MLNILTVERVLTVQSLVKICFSYLFPLFCIILLGKRKHLVKYVKKVKNATLKAGVFNFHASRKPPGNYIRILNCFLQILRVLNDNISVWA